MKRFLHAGRAFVANSVARENAIWWLVFVAFALRVAAMFDKGVLYDGGFHDAIGYMESARVLLSTGSLTFYEASPSAQVMPGFVFFLAGLTALAPTTFAEYLIVKLVILVISTASVYLLYLLGRRVGGTSVGLVAAGILTISLPHIYAGTLALTENVFLFLLLGLALATIHLADKPGWCQFVIAAAIFVVALYVRQAAFGFLLPALIYLVVRRYPWKLMVQQAVALVIIASVALAPWWLRNYSAFDEFVPFTTLGGAPFFEGTFQRFHPYESEAFEVMAELLDDFEGSEPERGRMLAEAGREHLAARWQDDPVDVIVTYGIRKPAAAWLLPFYWDAVFGISGYWVLRLHALLSVVGIGLLAWLSMRSRSAPEFLLLFLNVLIITVGTAYYLGLSRYVFPYVPFLYVAIGYGLVSAWHRLRRSPR